MVRYVRIVYTDHARRRMVERSVLGHVTAEVLADPDQVYQDGEEMVAERVLADGKPWRVVYAEVHAPEGLVVRVVTVHRLRRLSAR